MRQHLHILPEGVPTKHKRSDEWCHICGDADGGGDEDADVPEQQLEQDPARVPPVGLPLPQRQLDVGLQARGAEGRVSGWRCIDRFPVWMWTQPPRFPRCATVPLRGVSCRACCDHGRSIFSVVVLDSPCECEHNHPDSLDARLFPSVVLAVAPAVRVNPSKGGRGTRQLSLYTILQCTLLYGV